MRISTSHLQQLTIFTTILTGGGVGTMYCLLQQKFAGSDYHRLALRELEACPLAMESLGAPPLKVHNIHLTDRYNRVDQHTAQIKIPVTGSKAGGILYTSSLMDPSTNSLADKLQETESEDKTVEKQLRLSLLRDLLETETAAEPGGGADLRWSLKQAVLNLREGQIIDLLSPPSATAQSHAAEHTEGAHTAHWH